MTSYYDTYATLYNKLEPTLKIFKRKNKLTTMLVIDVKNYHLLLEYDFTVNMLKEIASKHKLNMSGNKLTLIKRIYIHLFLSSKTICIQKRIRGYFHRKYVSLHGPGFKNKLICNNNFDILTLDELTTIPYNQYFSFKDDDNFIYGFDFISFFNLLKQNNPCNPFNKNKLTTKTVQQFHHLLTMSRLLQYEYKIKMHMESISTNKKTELRIVSLFQKIDELGNYSNPEWFLSLDKTRLCNFLSELIDIWEYRAELTDETKCNICPPDGNPFYEIDDMDRLYNCTSRTTLRNIILNCLEMLVHRGRTNENKSLGALYILSALTLVNSDAATSLPWLYESMQHN
jgi:hypothetical protein